MEIPHRFYAYEQSSCSRWWCVYITMALVDTRATVTVMSISLVLRLSSLIFKPNLIKVCMLVYCQILKMQLFFL